MLPYLMDIVQKAEEFATKAHKGQKRKYTGEDYIVHPKRVVSSLKTITDDPEIIAAAWLHDVIEDTDTNIESIEINFGNRVATLVNELTDISKESDGTKEVRKLIDFEHNRNASPDAKTIRLADILDNTWDVVDFAPEKAESFLKEKLKMLEILTEGNQQLLKAAKEQIARELKRIGTIT